MRCLSESCCPMQSAGRLCWKSSDAGLWRLVDAISRGDQNEQARLARDGDGDGDCGSEVAESREENSNRLPASPFSKWNGKPQPSTRCRKQYGQREDGTPDRNLAARLAQPRCASTACSGSRDPGQQIELRRRGWGTVYFAHHVAVTGNRKILACRTFRQRSGNAKYRPASLCAPHDSRLGSTS